MKNFILSKKLILTAICTISLSACSTVDRLKNVGEAPEMTRIENPAERSEYRSVSMPMPKPQLESRASGSLWSSGRQAFFKDQRAAQEGDILTVLIAIDDEAEISNTSSRSRSNSEDAEIPALGGYETSLISKLFDEGFDPTNVTDFGSTSSSQGTGTTEREEEIDMRIAAVITQVLPNGNFFIVGRQEVRVNFEKRVLEIAGVIRPEDISVNNTISHDQIAEARVAYGGKGQITDVQQPRYGQQIYDILFPF